MNTMGGMETIVSTSHDTINGYIQMGFYDPDGVVAAQDVLTEAELSLERVILDVEYPAVPL